MSDPDNLKIFADLKAEIATLPTKTLAARLRMVMPEIDQQIKNGVQHEQILEVLQSHGFDLKLQTFQQYLYRYRRKAREAGKQTNLVTTKPSVVENTMAPTIRHRGDLAKLRDTDFDMQALAEIGKQEERG